MPLLAGGAYSSVSLTMDCLRILRLLWSRKIQATLQQLAFSTQLCSRGLRTFASSITIKQLVCGYMMGALVTVEAVRIDVWLLMSELQHGSGEWRGECGPSAWGVERVRSGVRQ